MSINTASVKVMRSYDYCHFEICLSSDIVESPTDVDNLRKEAARLADKAVEQYKIAKLNAELSEGDEYKYCRLKDRAMTAEQKPEGERTPDDKAAIKYFRDLNFHQKRRRYNYEDEWAEPDWEECYGDDESF